MSHRWLITGASNGLGAALAIACLEAGHVVVATARNVTKAQKDYPAIESKGGKWLKLDVTQPDTESIVRKVVEEDNIDVIVNNAGFGARGVLEDLSLDDVRAQFETNVFGAIAVMKGAIPVFRQRRAGTIVNISSTAGMAGNPGSSIYSSSKFALEGVTEGLALELKPFNVRCLIVQPGGFRTEFQANVVRPAAGRLSEPYKGTAVNDFMDKLEDSHGKQPGSPEKAAQAIIETVTGKGAGKDLQNVARLALGNDAVDRMRRKIGELEADIDKTEQLSRWAVYDS